jgi:hypothetical protein
MPNARAPYGRQRSTTSLSTDPDRAHPLASTEPGDQARETSFPQTETRWARKPGAYDGETYYGRPALKPSPYGQLIASYFFVGGLAGAAQLIAGIADVCGHDDDQPVVRAGRYLGLAGILLSPVLLIADLRTHRGWYNMLRIFRRTSAMSIGAWTLTGFGLLSGVAAAAQALYARTVSTLASVATLAGGYMLRSVLISAGNASAQRPDDYFQFIQPHAAIQPQQSPPTLAAQCQQAVDRLKQALHEPPSCLGKDVDAVEQIVTRLRDRLIHRLHHAGSSPEATRWQAALERINAALSLIVGVEYPIAGIRRSAIAQASATLAQVLTDRLLV